MTGKNTDTGFEPNLTERPVSAKTLSTVGWSLFLIWLGIVLLVEVSMGVVLLGVGGITLGMQAARKYLGLDLEKAWIGVGLVFALGGMWELMEVKLPLMPLILVAAGVVLLVSALRKKGDSEE